MSKPKPKWESVAILEENLEAGKHLRPEQVFKQQEPEENTAANHLYRCLYIEMSLLKLSTQTQSVESFEFELNVWMILERNYPEH